MATQAPIAENKWKIAQEELFFHLDEKKRDLFTFRKFFFLFCVEKYLYLICFLFAEECSNALNGNYFKIESNNNIQ